MYVSGTRRPKTYATICDLPQELLHLILSYLKDRQYWLKRCCSRVCRCLHAACLEIIDFRVVKVYDLNSPRLFTAFIEDHPRVARTIVELRLSGRYGHPQPTMNAALMARILGQLLTLRKLTLSAMRFDGTEATDVDASAPGPTSSTLDGRFLLDRLDLSYHTHEQSLLPEVFRIASLFEVEELNLGFSDCLDITSASIPFSLPRPLYVLSLKVNDTLRNTQRAAVMFNALSVHLLPGVLERLEVSVDSAEGIHGLGRLLSGPACSNVTHLDLNSHPPVSQYGIRYGWRGHEDPLLDEWPSLNVASCPRLESLVLHVYAQDPLSDTPLCSAAAGIISQAPPALRRPTLKIMGCTPESLLNAQWLGLRAVDQALSVPSRFPQLERLTLRLDINEWDYPGWTERCEVACKAALARVHAAEKLAIFRILD